MGPCRGSEKSDDLVAQFNLLPYAVLPSQGIQGTEDELAKVSGQCGMAITWVKGL